MKLHRVGVTNLNSLYGSHSVDLDRDLQGASLFLIEGPTGSGKSTLMDAVSLALFGTTPRMETQRSEKQVAEQVMSRDTGACAAELVFSKWSHAEGARVHYRARWMARRAHEKADGQIQAPERSLERREGSGEWELLTSDHRRKFYQPHFDAVLEDFSPEDFRRSMLLAQGQFDAMLHASPEERARILERLTDTSEYKRIGERAARIHGAWKGRLRELDRELEGREPVDPERIAAAEQARSEVEAAMARVEERLEAVRVRRDWLEAEGKWVGKVEAARKEREAAERALESRAGLAARIEEHDRCAEGFALLDAVEKQGARVAEAGEAIEALEVELPGLREAVETAAAKRDALVGRHAAAEGALQELEPVVDQAQEARVRYEAEAQREASAEKTYAEARAELQTRKAGYAEAHDALAGALRELRDQLLPGAVPTGASSWRIEVEAALGSHGIPEAPTEVEGGVGDSRGSLDAPRFVEAAGAIRDFRDRAQARARDARGALDARAALESTRTDLREREKAWTAAREALEAAEQAVETADRERTEARERRDRAREVMAPLERIRAHQEERRKLVEGEPCPLCGSTDHPLADTEADSALRSEIADAGAALEAAEAALNQAEASFHSAQGTREAARAQVEERQGEATAVTRRVDETAAAWSRLAEELGLDPETGTDELRRREEDAGSVRSWLQDVLDRVSSAAGRYETWSKARDEVERAEVGTGKAEEALKTAAAVALRAREAFEDSMEAVLRVWGAAVALDREETPDRPGSTEDLKALKKSQQGVVGALASSLKEAREHHASAQERRTEGATRLATLRESLERETAELTRLQGRLDAELRRLEVASVEALAARRLPEDSLREGRAEVERLRKSLEEADTRLSTLRREQKAHAEAKPEPFTLDWLDGEPTPERFAAALEELARERTALNERVSEARSVLLEAERVAEEIRKLESARTALRARAEVWHELHELIGVNDGDRFREFAQALNLDQLLHRANRHLARLKDRYRLVTVRDPETGVPTLEFEVEDRWRPGTTRSLKTLSGGESFLVSLALALGLSDLRTSSMPVETLLLDEGFGTLDPETLDEALAALQQLQASGRQIGIISHVAGLKERIDARIQVQPLGNGQSRVRAVVSGLA